jgi:hypothetical protein
MLDCLEQGRDIPTISPDGVRIQMLFNRLTEYRNSYNEHYMSSSDRMIENEMLEFMSDDGELDEERYTDYYNWKNSDDYRNGGVYNG